MRHGDLAYPLGQTFPPPGDITGHPSEGLPAWPSLEASMGCEHDLTTVESDLYQPYAQDAFKEPKPDVTT